MNNQTIEIANKLLDIITNMENKNFREEIIIDQIKKELTKIIGKPEPIRVKINEILS